MNSLARDVLVGAIGAALGALLAEWIKRQRVAAPAMPATAPTSVSAPTAPMSDAAILRDAARRVRDRLDGIL